MAVHFCRAAALEQQIEQQPHGTRTKTNDSAKANESTTISILYGEQKSAHNANIFVIAAAFVALFAFNSVVGPLDFYENPEKQLQ